MLEKFINSCLLLDIRGVKEQIGSVVSIQIFNGEEYDLLKRIENLFNEFRNDNPLVTVSDDICNGCSKGTKTKLFNVTYQNNPNKNSQFGFLIESENGIISHIHECTQYKAYQDKLSKRIFAGKTEIETMLLKSAIEGLPEL